MMHKRYFTSSPGIGTYSPSMLMVYRKRENIRKSNFCLLINFGLWLIILVHTRKCEQKYHPLRCEVLWNHDLLIYRIFLSNPSRQDFQVPEPIWKSNLFSIIMLPHNLWHYIIYNQIHTVVELLTCWMFSFDGL